MPGPGKSSGGCGFVLGGVEDWAFSLPGYLLAAAVAANECSAVPSGPKTAAGRVCV